ncbi:MAG: hypothetical protein PHU14_00105, partial [Methylovulum sp.]|nr:hypothetical protein [Methylovulum sp.]
VRELALYGEQCWPTFVNEFSGAVRLGYLDPGLIETVVVDPDNGEQPIGIVTARNKKGVSKRYRVIVNGSEDEMFTQRTQDIRQTFSDGDCFYFCINDLSSSRRGCSDLLSQTDWLDSYDQFMFGELDRVQFLRAFMWDVTLRGATEDDVNKKAKSIRPPKPGSVRVHNDSEEWQAQSPNIAANDTDLTAKLFRNHILGGGTIPEHWFGGAGDVNRATGEDMSGPTFKVMSMRQMLIGHILVEIGRYVLRQWELAHNGAEPDLADPIYHIYVEWPEMVAKDTAKYAAALQQVTMAAASAIQAGLLSQITAIAIIGSIARQLGVGFDAEKELAAILEQGTDTSVGADTNQPESVTLTEAAGVASQATPADPPGDMLGLLGKTAQPAIDAMLVTIRAMLDTADDLPDAMQKLAGLFPEMDDTALAEVLAKALTASYLAGMNDVAEGQ